MLKTAVTATAIVLFGVAVGFSGILGGEASMSTEAAADAAFAAATTAHANATAAAAAAAEPAANGPTPEICGRIINDYSAAYPGDPDGPATSTAQGATRHAMEVSVQRRLEAAGCTAAYLDTHGEAVLAVVNRNRSPSQYAR